MSGSDENAAPSADAISRSISMCRANAGSLLADARLLLDWDRFSTALAVGVLAQEEFAKAFLLQLVADGAVPWLPGVRRSINQHTCKHLLAVVMRWLPKFDGAAWGRSGDLFDELKIAYDCGEISADDFLEELNGWKSSFLIPENVRSAWNIYRHEHLERLSSGEPWRDEEWAKGEVRKIADGSLDEKKQSALYVSIGKTGEVRSHPGQVTRSEASVEIARAEALSDPPERKSREYEILRERLPGLFADLAQPDRSSRG